MVSSSGVAVAFNGEVYNHPELRAELEADGVRFTSSSDTEVVLAAYGRWGIKAFERFVGMWALAIVDPQNDSLILSRDPFGIKPLYFATSQDEVVFASEIGPILDVGWVDPAPDLERVQGFLGSARSDDGDRTFHVGVQQVQAGTVMEFALNASDPPRVTRYRTLDPGPQLDVSFAEAVALVRDAFVESVELHLRSDVPVGACLSGGIDSSAIVCAMREIGGSALDLHTFSYVSSDPVTTEERWIDIVNRRTGATAHVVAPGPADFGRDLDQLVCAHHEPVASTSVYAQFRVFQLAADAGVKVLLDGQGADELLAGYRGYRSVMLRQAVRDRSVRRAITLATGLARTSTTGHNDLVEVLRSQMGRRVRSRLAAPTNPNMARPPARQPATLRDLLIDATAVSSLPALLRYEDRNSMAHSIESRVPFLTPKFADLVLRLPADHLVSSTGVTKRVFREAMRGLVPDEVLDRRDKIGFSPTETAWIRHAQLAVPSAVPDQVDALVASGLQERLVAVGEASRPDPASWRAWSVLDWAARAC